MPNMSKQYQLILGTFIDNEFVWHDVNSYEDLDSAYKAFKKYVNDQLKYSDEDLIKVWNSGRLDIELRRGNRLLNWVGIYAREVSKLTEEEEEKAEKEIPEKKTKAEDSAKPSLLERIFGKKKLADASSTAQTIEGIDTFSLINTKTGEVIWGAKTREAVEDYVNKSPYLKMLLRAGGIEIKQKTRITQNDSQVIITFKTLDKKIADIDPINLFGDSHKEDVMEIAKKQAVDIARLYPEPIYVKIDFYRYNIVSQKYELEDSAYYILAPNHLRWDRKNNEQECIDALKKEYRIEEDTKEISTDNNTAKFGYLTVMDLKTGQIIYTTRLYSDKDLSLNRRKDMEEIEKFFDRNRDLKRRLLNKELKIIPHYGTKEKQLNLKAGHYNWKESEARPANENPRASSKNNIAEKESKEPVYADITLYGELYYYTKGAEYPTATGDKAELNIGEMLVDGNFNDVIAGRRELYKAARTVLPKLDDSARERIREKLPVYCRVRGIYESEDKDGNLEIHYAIDVLSAPKINSDGFIIGWSELSDDLTKIKRVAEQNIK